MTLRGSYYVPSASWQAGLTLWFRVREFTGTPPENLTGSEANPVLDAWTPFEYTLTTAYEPEARKDLSIQLFSKTAEGTAIYVDDVFVEVIWKETMVEPTGNWPVNCVKLSEGQTITVDGQVTADEYAGAQAIVLNTETHVGVEDPHTPGAIHNGALNPASVETPLDDYSATCYVMWDAENFYIAMSAVDDVVYPATQDWSVEVKISWTALQDAFEDSALPPAVGDQMGFSCIGIDFNAGLEWFGSITDEFLWTPNGLDYLTFIE